MVGGANKKGMFVSFEGCDFSGKTTQIELLAAHLRSLGLRVLVTREPGGSTGAEEIRNLLFSNTLMSNPCIWRDMFLFAAARAEHLEKIILPALEQGISVLSDRYIFSSLVYQGIIGGISTDAIMNIHKKIPFFRMPDITFILDIPFSVIQKRAQMQREHYNAYDDLVINASYHEKMRDAYQNIANKEADSHLIDGSISTQEIEQEIRKIILKN